MTWAQDDAGGLLNLGNVVRLYASGSGPYAVRATTNATDSQWDDYAVLDGFSTLAEAQEAMRGMADSIEGN
jgi:hypothetical protein